MRDDASGRAAVPPLVFSLTVVVISPSGKASKCLLVKENLLKHECNNRNNQVIFLHDTEAHGALGMPRSRTGALPYTGTQTPKTPKARNIQFLGIGPALFFEPKSQIHNHLYQ